MSFERLREISVCLKMRKSLIDIFSEERELAADLEGGERLAQRLDAMICGYRSELEALQRERMTIIQAAAKLPEKQRNAIILHYDAGMTWKEVSDALGVSLRYVYKLRGAALE